jgi:Meiotically up-regulated gene 113
LLTPNDIRDSSRRSGFQFVIWDEYSTRGPYRAQRRVGPDTEARSHWYGPRRATAEEAAQDYCDYINGSGVTPATPLKSAGHKGKRRRLSDDPEVAAALGVLRDARGQRQGNQGYVYCITDGEYIKIGYSTKPEARLAELQTGNARKLSLVGSKPGTVEDEAALHQKYIEHNVLQEWFRLDAAILSEFNRKDNATP